MSLAARFALVGILGGALLGVGAAIGAVGIAAGVGWLYLFGDDPWPAAADAMILSAGAFAFLAFTAGGGVLGWFYGRARDRNPPERRRNVRRVAAALLVGLPVCAVLAFVLWPYASLRSVDRVERNEAEAYLEALHTARQRIVESRAERPDARGRVVLRLAVRGQHAGSYGLRWRAAIGDYDMAVEGARRLDLRSGENEIAISVPANELGERFRDAALTDPTADAGADLHIEVTIRLTPEPTQAERARLPDYELRNLERGFSRLADDYRTTIEVGFDFRGGRVSVRR